MIALSETTLELLAWRHIETLPDEQVFQLLFDDEYRVRTLAGRVIHLRGTDYLFEKTCTLQHEEKAYLRDLCAFILGQIQVSKLEQIQQIPNILFALAQDKRIQVKESAIYAFGHFYCRHAEEIPVSNEILSMILSYSKHPSTSIRCAVAFSLMSMPDCLAVRQTIDELRDDDDFDVCDWADIALEVFDEKKLEREKESLSSSCK